ncbi:MAG TPA: hypothetical protein VF486_17020 [Actinomycetes bacterium]
MDHDGDREVAGAVRALLVEATGDEPPETDLLDGVRHRVRRRRVLVPSLVTLTTASAIAVAALAASVVTGTGTPSAQARVAAAAGRTAGEGYRVRIVSTAQVSASTTIVTADGVFNPAQRTGRLLLAKGLGQGRSMEIRFVGDVVYTALPSGSSSNGKHWVSERRSLDLDLPPFVLLTKQAWHDPQQALARLRSAATVHEQGRVSGAGWSGRRYTYEWTDDQQVKSGIHRQVTGTVDVDQSGRVRRLEATERVTTAAGGTAATLRTVMEFRDYGTHETVSAPPAGQVTDAADLVKRAWRKDRARRSSKR